MRRILMLDEKVTDWSNYVKEMEYRLITNVHNGTQFKPYELAYSRLPPSPAHIDPIRKEGN